MNKTNDDLSFNIDYSYCNLPNLFFSFESPEGSINPNLIKFNEDLADELDLDKDILQSKEGVNLFGGNNAFSGGKSIAKAYAGHQFGYFTMLGDGRAILLGEHIDKLGNRYDIELKGSGLTPYSRGGDGKAVLGPMLREYVISEAMNSLGIPTTRSLAVVKTGEMIARNEYEDGAILTRVAKSHIRVGTFCYAGRWGDIDDLEAIADYTIDRHFPKLKNLENKYLILLNEVIKLQASLVAKWMSVGFIHGVMNTDNMSICGETIDYGPCAFMDEYNSNTVFSSIDYQGRYAYGNQPNMAMWNLSRFAEPLLGLIDKNMDKAIIMATDAIKTFPVLYKKYFEDIMRKKLGLFEKFEEDEHIIEGLLSILEKYREDYTNTFYYLTIDKYTKINCFESDELKAWIDIWHKRLAKENKSKVSVKTLMKANNPVIIPRNHRVEEAIGEAKLKNYALLNKLIEVLKNPYDYESDLSYYRETIDRKGVPYRTYCGT